MNLSEMKKTNMVRRTKRFKITASTLLKKKKVKTSRTKKLLTLLNKKVMRKKLMRTIKIKRMRRIFRMKMTNLSPKSISMHKPKSKIR